jgi:glycosyltransferase involved in cell wall biosynthesis
MQYGVAIAKRLQFRNRLRVSMDRPPKKRKFLRGRLARHVLGVMLLIAALPVLIVASAIARIRYRSWIDLQPIEVRLAWGGAPILNFSHWSRIMEASGWKSSTYVTGYYSINRRCDWDHVCRSVTVHGRKIPGTLALSYVTAFSSSLFRADIFFMSVEGFLLAPFRVPRLEHFLLRLAGKRIVILPYGSDAYVYRRIKSPANAHCLQTHYGQAARDQTRLAKRLDFQVAHADCFIPGTMGPDGMGRWDALVPSILFLDPSEWLKSTRIPIEGQGMTVVHSPNHRGVKGTEFLIDAVNQLSAEGFEIELRLLEGLQNTEVKRILETEADLLVELLIGPGHGLSALEGMAAGLPVISNLEDDDHFLPFRRWSYFSECPIVSASPENIKSVLKALYLEPGLRQHLGDLGRQYVEKYHGTESAVFLFTAVIEFVMGRRDTLISLHHPLVGEHPGLRTPLKPPLDRNRLQNL